MRRIDEWLSRFRKGMNCNVKIVVFGDSISEGIGKRKVNYCDPLQERLRMQSLDLEITNYAYTGTTLLYLRDKLSDIEPAQVAVIGYGNVDAMLRPNQEHKPNYYQYIPQRYKRNGMLNPRPYFSSRWYKAIPQHIDSWIRWHLNKTLLALQGSTTWVAIDVFERTYRACIADLRSKGCSAIVLLSTVRVNDRFFPGTNEMYQRFNEVIHCVAKDHGCCFIDLYNLLQPDDFYEDGFHPNPQGYRKIADAIGNDIISMLGADSNE